MKINLIRKNTAFHLEATNATGNSLHIDAGPAIGGEDLGFRSMELLLAGIGGCSSMDILHILRKQKQEVTDYRVEVTGERAKDQVPAVFTDIHLDIHLTGNLDAAKVERAVKLSVEKYCSVAKMLEKTAKITYQFTIHDVSL